MPTFVGEMRETKYLEISNIDEVNNNKTKLKDQNIVS